MKKRSSNLALLGVILICGLTLSCNSLSEKDQIELKSLAGEIDSLFVQARKEIEALKTITEELLKNPENPYGLLDDSRYKYSENHVYYTPENDGYCEVWASGYIPIGASERKRIKVLENLCPDLQRIYNKNDFIDTIHLITYDSVVVGYPHSDIQIYMEPGLDLTQVWVAYRAAAGKQNSEKKTLWVTPYIDALGGGYMISIITPIYQNDFLEGTLGINITVDLISDKFISLSEKNLMIMTPTAIPVAMNKNSSDLLKIKGLEKYNYLQKESENRAICSSLMMTESDSPEIRSLGQKSNT